MTQQKNQTPSQEEGANGDLTDKDPRLGRLVRFSPLIVVAPIVLYSCAVSGADASFWTIMAISSMAAIAATMVGGFFGFLFALPRTLERPNATGLLATNSNLDQVSDWLTKAIVGVSLIQLGHIAGGFGDVGSAMADALGEVQGAQTFSLFLLVFCIVDGFLVGYLWTRLIISSHLQDAAANLAQAFESAIDDAPSPLPSPAAPPAPGQVVPTVSAQSDAPPTTE